MAYPGTPPLSTHLLLLSCKVISMKRRITVASAVVAAAAAFTSALLARRARFFAQAPPQRNETFTTSAGPVELPVRYHDGSLIGAFWLVEETKAAARKSRVQRYQSSVSIQSQYREHLRIRNATRTELRPVLRDLGAHLSFFHVFSNSDLERMFF